MYTKGKENLKCVLFAFPGTPCRSVQHWSSSRKTSNVSWPGYLTPRASTDLALPAPTFPLTLNIRISLINYARPTNTTNTNKGNIHPDRSPVAFWTRREYDLLLPQTQTITTYHLPSILSLSLSLSLPLSLSLSLSSILCLLGRVRKYLPFCPRKKQLKNILVGFSLQSEYKHRILKYQSTVFLMNKYISLSIKKKNRNLNFLPNQRYKDFISRVNIKEYQKMCYHLQCTGCFRNIDI